MSYDEHLISMAGGDGEPVDLAAIEARDKASDPLCTQPCPSEECAAMQDRRTLLTLVREQRAALALIANQCNAAEMLCRMNGSDPEFAIVPAVAIRAAITATEEGK